jgi:hypothetical protein
LEWETKKAKNPVNDEPCPEFKEWVNHFLELHGMHRFKDDLENGATSCYDFKMEKLPYKILTP